MPPPTTAGRPWRECLTNFHGSSFTNFQNIEEGGFQPLCPFFPNVPAFLKVITQSRMSPEGSLLFSSHALIFQVALPFLSHFPTDTPDRL